MKKSLKTLTISALCFGLVVTLLPEMLAAQDLHESRRPSPMGMARTTLDGGAYVRIVYSRPYLRGRDNIFGTEESEALVPFGKIWRTGANEATEITVTDDVLFGDKKLPAGTYSLFTTPGEKEWTIHVNSALGLSGTFAPNPETGQFEMAYKSENDVVTATAAVASPKTEDGEDKEVDQLTISFEDVEEGVHLVIQWADAEVRVPVKPAG